MEESTDLDVWQRMLDGDSRAFGLIWDRHRDRVFRTLYMSGESHSDAEDLTAVAFLELWRRRRQVRFVDGSVLPWLLVTAHNVQRNAARAARRYQAFLAQLPPPEHAPDPADAVLADRPAGATHVRVTISALTAGSVSWGTDADGNNPSAAFTADDLHAANGAVSWFDFPLDESTPTFFLQPSVGFTASVSFQYLNQTPTHLERNANGETYGVAGGPDGDPDLVAVTATAVDGSLAEGYARASDLAAFSPEHPDQPSTPEEATSWQEERDAASPRGWSVPVFESDGETQIGTFHIG